MYPDVLSEQATLDLVCQGRSLARFGDGEIALLEGRAIRPQVADPVLARRLRGILTGVDAGACLVGIPNLRAALPQKKEHFWAKYARIAPDLTPGYPYVSAFVSRPDSAPWLDVPAYWAALASLWQGREVVLVRGDDPQGTGAVSLRAADLTGASAVREVIAPGVNAWAASADLLEAIGRPARALLCLGATATVLAVDLCARGVHAVDLGHVGMFLRWHRAGRTIHEFAKPIAIRRRRLVAAG